MIPLINRIAALTHANSRRDAAHVQTRGTETTGRGDEMRSAAKLRRERAAKKRAYTRQLTHFSAEFVDSKDAATFAENTAAVSLRQRQQLWHDVGAAASAMMSFESVSDTTEDVILVEESQYPIIHPNGKWKGYWDLWIRVLVLYNVIMVPYRIGFAQNAHGVALGFDIAGDFCFAIDMAVNFRTAFFDDEGDLVTSLSEIAKNYLRQDFAIDLLSTFPFDYISMLFSTGHSQAFRATKMLRMFRLAKMFRFIKAMNQRRGLEIESERNQFWGLWGLVELLLKLGYVAHLIGCLWHWVTVLHDEDDGITWLEAFGIDHAGLPRKYAASVYYAYTTMSTIGYGDITPANDAERGVAVLAEVIGASIFGYVIGNITAMISNLNLADSLEGERLDAVKEYVHDRKLPRPLASRIVRQYKYLYKHGSAFDSGPLLEGLPANTCTMLLLAQYQELITHVDFLSTSHPHFVTYFAQKMKPFFANRGEVLVYQGEVGFQMYFVGSGRVTLLVTKSSANDESATSTQKITTIKKGSFFGEAAILLDIGQPYTAIATGFSEMYFVSREDVLAATEEWPDLKQQLQRQAQQIVAAVEAIHQEKLAEVIAPVQLHVPPALSFANGAFEDPLSWSDSASDTKPLTPSKKPLPEVDVVSDLQRLEEQAEAETPEALWRLHRVIHPDAPQKACWDVFMCLLIVYSVVMVTFRLSFNQEADTAGFVIDCIVDVSFFIDILLSFRTAYYDENGVLVTDPKRIVHGYLTGWFTLDFISTVPLDLILGGVVSNSNALRSTKLLRTIRLVRFVKIMRLLKVSGFFDKYEETLPINIAVVRILKLLVVFGFAAHIFACVWFAVGSHQGSSWIKEYCIPSSMHSSHERCLDDMHVSSQYLASMYWAVTTMSTVGYGDITPSSSSTGEIVAAMVMQIISTTLYAYIVGTLVSLILNLNPHARAEKQQRRMFVEYMKAVGVPITARQTAFRQFAFRLQLQSASNEQEILNGLSTHLRSRCFTFLYRNSLPRLPTICSIEERFPGAIMAILPLLRPSYYAKNEVLFSPKLDAREAAFLIRGACDCINSSNKVLIAHYRAGDHFGEQQILVPAYVPFMLKVEVRAVTNSKVLLLSRHDFWYLQQTYPSLGELIAEVLGAGSTRDEWMHAPHTPMN